MSSLASFTRIGANAPRLLALIGAALLSAAGCHSGEEHGPGTACDDSHPCRGGLVCMGTCQVARDAGPDISADRAPDGDGSSVPETMRPEAPDADLAEGGPPFDLPPDDSEAPPDMDVARDVADASDATTISEVEPDQPLDAVPDSIDSGSVLSSPYPPRPCDRTRPFERIRPLDGLQSVPGSHDETAHLTPDELTLYFASNRIDSVGIYTTTRPTRDGTFTKPRLINSLKGALTDQRPSLTADQLTIYFESNRTDYNTEIYRADRVAPGKDWNPPEQVLTISPVGMQIHDGGPSISGDGRVMYFHSTRSGRLDIFRAETVDENGTFGESLPVRGINTADYEEARPVVSSDELTIYYVSNRPDGGARGGWDIWMATRASKDAAFDDVVNVTELNTDGSDSPGWLSADQCDLYFAQNTAQGERLFVASRPLRTGDAGADGP
ncbi:MAG TPA: hypothetical protein VNO55_33345 [Polyangia bacterium]|nr:hypothetical protein [Polyangia bacterium]